jgi:ubiquinone/menaquinone biosynthesis C-methylase UbiE
MSCQPELVEGGFIENHTGFDRLPEKNWDRHPDSIFKPRPHHISQYPVYKRQIFYIAPKISAFTMFPLFYDRKNNTPYSLENGKYTSGVRVAEIINGIPRFASDGSYASLFGDQWKQYKKTQLDSYTGSPITETRLDRCLGDLKDKLAGKTVLEAGCGAGRFTEVLLKKGAILVSSDLSSAVEVNAENFPVSDKHLVIQSDINDMPFADESFDVVICLGVIQHTADTEKTIEDLYKLVKSGGTLVIDHYTFDKSNYFRLAPLYRRSLRKKTSDYTIPYTQKLVKRYLPWHKRFAKNKILSVLLNRISPVISYYSAFPQFTDAQQEEWALLDTHDSLTDWHKRFRNKNEITTTLIALGAVDIWCAYGGNGVEARCKKP